VRRRSAAEGGEIARHHSLNVQHYGTVGTFTDGLNESTPPDYNVPVILRIRLKKPEQAGTTRFRPREFHSGAIAVAPMIGSESMQLSILFATNRKGLLACSRIAQACSWASPDVEVIVRDNSGDAQKCEFLALCRRDHCKIVIVEPCDILTNFSETLRMAKGEFVFVLADDDFCFDHAIAALPGVLGQYRKDPSVVGVTGAYAVEGSQGTSIMSYPNAESDDVVARVSGYLTYSGPNILHYAPMRREIVERVFNFMNAMPALFSFHDQVISLLYLLNGKFVRLNRLLYLYDVGVWGATDSAQKRDVDFYKDAGLDPAINKLHWFLCGFEGAVLARNSDIFPEYPIAQRQVIADRWFSAMFMRFQGHARLTFESRFTGEADKLCAKLLTSTGQLSFQDMLAEICSLIALFSKGHAQRYHDFWSAVLNRRAPVPHVASIAAKKRAV
jgi:hypothetical protein